MIEAAFRFAQQRQRVARQPQNGVDVDFAQPRPFVIRQLTHLAAHENACVVDEHVGPAVRRIDLADERGQILSLRNINDHRGRGTAGRS